MFKKLIAKIKYELQFNNTSYLTRISDKFFKFYYQLRLRKKINRLPPLVLNTNNALLTLATIANKKRFYESVAALYSFCHWERNIYIHYHEDGTLGPEEFEILHKLFPGITIFSRKEQDVKMQQHLQKKGLEVCARFREKFLFAVKLMDMVVEKKTPYLLHIDSDVIFFKKPDEILEIAHKQELNGCFNAEKAYTYTFDDAVIKKYVDMPMLDHFNSGLLMFNFDETFFDFIEKVMANEFEAINSWHLEQTLFAMYASLKGNFMPLPKSYDVGRHERKPGHNLTAEHYCHSTGYDMHKDFLYKIVPSYHIR